MGTSTFKYQELAYQNLVSANLAANKDWLGQYSSQFQLNASVINIWYLLIMTRGHSHIWVIS